MALPALDLAARSHSASASASPSRSPSRSPGRERGRPLSEIAAPGRLVELCGAAQTSAAVAVLADVQREGETAAWIQPAQADLYAPDLAAFGVDVEALIVVHVPEHPSPGAGAVHGPAGQCRAAELLLRSGGFGLIVLDFGRAQPRSSSAWQGRLLGLARQHEARVLILRRSSQRAAGLDSPPQSLGPLIGVRVASHVVRAPSDDPPGFRPRTGQFELHHEVIKNKSGGPLEPAPTRIRGPWGLV